MTFRRNVLAASAAAALASLALAGPALASAAHHPHHHPAQFRVRIVLNGAKLKHTFKPNGTGAPQTEALADPDDITVLGHDLFVGFQNGVPSAGGASADGNLDSTIVEFTPRGHVVRKWDIVGKCDGLTADTGARVVIATVDEDGNSSIYTIAPRALPGRQVTHYAYSQSPLPHNGGTDAISIYHGKVLISASAPGAVSGSAAAPQATYPAVYSAAFHRNKTVTLTPVFYDEANAATANTGAGQGKIVQLVLTDPDSNEDVPSFAPRFAGDFMLTSQGDQEQIFVKPGHDFGSNLHVLSLTHSVDDTAWARSSGTLYGDNTSHDWVEAVSGPFRRGEIFAAVTPCDQNDAPATCPGPGFPANYLGTVNPWTGVLTRVTLHGPAFNPQGMVFVGPRWEVTPG